jgi:hydroxyethylthiazole kinase
MGAIPVPLGWAASKNRYCSSRGEAVKAPPQTSPARALAALSRGDGAEIEIVRLVHDIAEAFQKLRHEKPRVHCLTNSVAQGFTANLLLAAGAIPSMTVAPEEIAHFVWRAGALLVNLGTLDAERRAALPLALDTAASAGVPVVLDPVFVDLSPPRLALARKIIERKPAIIRMNGNEFQAVAGFPPTPEKVREVAGANHCVIALTGPSDIVSDGRNTIRVRNGHALMAQVTAMGCGAGALVAALLACRCAAFTAAACGLAALGVAGEVAAETAHGPGSFSAAILDALFKLDGAMLRARAHLQIGDA